MPHSMEWFVDVERGDSSNPVPPQQAFLLECYRAQAQALVFSGDPRIWRQTCKESMGKLLNVRGLLPSPSWLISRKPLQGFPSARFLIEFHN